ncbi:MAG: glycosyltransferase [Defluviitaleaceae bacterium]|nr:glycosyltransferase [Defluviitaleaceae bacterium]
MKRILIILPNLDLGGMETVVMNYFRHLDRSEVVFDFVVHGEAGFFEDEATSLGARIFRAPTRKQGFFKNISAMRAIYRSEKYETVIVCTEHSFAFIELLVAWMSGVKTRAGWSHFTEYQGASRLKRRAHFIARPLMRLFANQFFACTIDAGAWLFGKKFVNNLHKPAFHIINNAIDLKKFAICPEMQKKIRKKIRDLYGLKDDTFAIGIVGRLMPVKNHAFSLAVFKEIHRIFHGMEADKNARLFIIGDGELRQEIESQARRHAIAEHVIFTGAVSNIHEYYQALDALLIPSFHEGLTVVSVEAQASGLPVIISDTLTRDMKLSDQAHYIPLDAGATEWAKKVLTLTNHKRTAPNLSTSGFCIEHEAKKLQKILLEGGR